MRRREAVLAGLGLLCLAAVQAALPATAETVSQKAKRDGMLRVQAGDPAMLAAFGAFIGHLFPVWLKFRGGKGVATYIGVLLGLFWPAALIFCAIWLIVAFATRYSSLSALIASLVAPLVLWWFGHTQLAALFAVLTLLLWFAHRENIRRLLAGSESKIGAKA